MSRRQLTLFMSFLDFTSTRLGSEVSYSRTLPRKNPEDPVRLEPRTPGLRVKHFTTEPRGTLISARLFGIKRKCLQPTFSFIPTIKMPYSAETNLSCSFWTGQIKIRLHRTCSLILMWAVRLLLHALVKTILK